MSIKQPRWIQGNLFSDDRGALAFVNDFDLSRFVRFYHIQTNTARTIRAWQGHQYEHKAFYCLAGHVRIAVVAVDDWHTPSPDLNPIVFDLSADSPGILILPGGWANGIQPLNDSTELLVFSDQSLEKSKQDDFRFHPNYWNPWKK